MVIVIVRVRVIVVVLVGDQVHHGEVGADDAAAHGLALAAAWPAKNDIGSNSG